MRRLSLLGLADIIDQGSRRGDLGPAETAKAVKRSDPVEVFKPAAGSAAVEPGVGQRGQRRLPFGQHLEQRGAGEQPLGQQDFARCDAGKISGQGGFVRWRQRKGASRQIEPGKTDCPADLGQPGEIIVAAGVEEAVFGQCASRDHPDNRPAHRAFGAAFFRFGRVLDLFADRHLKAGANKPRQIGLGGVHRNAAHRNVGAVVPTAFGQRDIERLRRGHRVVKKQLEKIAHAKK